MGFLDPSIPTLSVNSHRAHVKFLFSTVLADSADFLFKESASRHSVEQIRSLLLKDSQNDYLFSRTTLLLKQWAVPGRSGHLRGFVALAEAGYKRRSLKEIW